MTTFDSEELICILCGYCGEFDDLTSYTTFESSDLDSRPGEMLRSTMCLWIQRCPSCGYCARNISVLEPEKPVCPEFLYLTNDWNGSQKTDVDIVRCLLMSPEYKKLSDVYGEREPQLAFDFYCGSLINELCGDYEGAHSYSMNAAWVCDDAANADARAFRERAAKLLLKKFENEPDRIYGNDDLVLIDLFRRLGRFDEAMEICVKGFRQNIEETAFTILAFQRKLILSEDTGCHKVSEAYETSQDTDGDSETETE